MLNEGFTFNQHEIRIISTRYAPASGQSGNGSARSVKLTATNRVFIGGCSARPPAVPGASQAAPRLPVGLCLLQPPDRPERVLKSRTGLIAL